MLEMQLGSHDELDARVKCCVMCKGFEEWESDA
jgi:hypothetical protein